MSTILERKRYGHPKKKGGRVAEPVRAAYVKRFKLSDPRLRTVPLDQLDGCKDDAARRLLLGVSR
jgi:hypothetical protein